MTELSPQSRRLVAVLYLFAIVIVADQVSDLFSSLWPMHFELARWRFGAFGIAIGRLEFLALADAAALAAAILLDHRRVLLALAGLHVLLALALAGGVGVFGLDTLQLRRDLLPERKREFDVATARTLFMSGLAFLTCLAVTIGVWRGRRPKARPAGREDGLLVTARGGSRTGDE